MNEHKTLSIDISSRTFLKVLLVVVGWVFLSMVKDVLLIVFIALVLTAALDPTVTAMERRGVPRGFGIAILYVVLIGFFSLMAVLVVPLVIDQLHQLAVSLPSLYTKALGFVHTFQSPTVIDGLSKGLQTVTNSLGSLTQGVFSRIFSFFGGLFAFIAIMVITFYLTMEERGMKRIAVDLAPEKSRPYLTQLFRRIEERLGRWLRGQLILGLIIAVAVYIGLLALGVKYALVLALFAGVTELLPAVGPFIGAVPAVLVGLSQHPWLGVAVAALYLVVQQLESHIIAPKVMAKATGVNPVIVIISLLVGAKLAGVVGVILAVPTMLIITTFLEDFLDEKRADDLRIEESPSS